MREEEEEEEEEEETQGRILNESFWPEQPIKPQQSQKLRNCREHAVLCAPNKSLN